MAAHPADDRWMALALSLGRRGLGRTWPNPAVGCVIVKDDRLLGRGWTQPGGRPHAETKALEQAGAGAKGATAYVTLEPCAHHGQTPPCASALIAAGISRVVTALSDPDSRVAGKGHADLRAAGITVEIGCGADQAKQDNAGFLKRVTQTRPMVSLKLATSFDGRIATSSGESQWITGPAARRLVHLERACHDAVMVGAGTAQADDPSLNARDLGVSHQPLRVICDTNLSTSPNGKLGQTAKDIPVWMCHGNHAPKSAKQAWADTGAKLLPSKTDSNGRLDIADVMKTLAEYGLTRVFCEGGGQLAASLLTADLVDQLIGFTAGLALGADGLPAIAALPNRPLQNHPRFTLTDSQIIGGDILHIWNRH